MKIKAVCPEHGSWYPDLKDRKSRATCQAPGCTAGRDGGRFRYIPKAADFRPAAASPPPAPGPEVDSGARLADVDAATGPLHEALRAMVRLMLSAAGARYHLRVTRATGHLSGIAAGPTERGKTLVAVVVCAALSLDEVTGIRQTAKETELSLWGRRVQETGGRWVLAPSAVLALPFVALDELDKATGALMKAALRLLQGDARADAEGQVVDVAPAAYATSNAGLGVVAESYRRRSACLDATGLPKVSYALARQVVAAVPRLALARLAPPAGEVPADVLERMEAALRAGLTGPGWGLCDLRALELAALGRAGLAGEDLAGAAMHTVVDYLELAATTGEAHPDWPGRLDAWASGTTAQDSGGAQAGDGPAEPVQPADAYWDRAEAVGLAGAISHRLTRAIEDLDEAVSLPGVPAALADQAAGIRQMSRDLLRPDLRKVKDVGRLAEILPSAERAIRLAEDLAGGMRARAAGVLAGEYEMEDEAALTAEAGRRLAARAGDGGTGGEDGPAPARPRGGPGSESWELYLELAGVGSAPTLPRGGGLRIQTTMRPLVIAPPRPARGRQAATVRTVPSVSAMLATATASQVTAPAHDTAAAAAIHEETRRREAAGLPPPTAQWMMRVVLNGPPPPPSQPAPARRGLLRRKAR